ncbi:long-chain-fatty-acid--coa ligase [hydrocarbon metagenome]|uniref:Long-chain-fatty-acid--coa ligase n=1 Tax=hydrocarbon metagenome TaxID=938273 RepID=A0A0W8FIS8_9ZZZZ
MEEKTPKKIIDIVPDPETLLILEPEELAGVVIEVLNSNKERNPSLLNSHNFSLPNIVEDYPVKYRYDILKALMEGWIWLEREGLIAPVPGRGTADSVFITRRGLQITDQTQLQSYRYSNLLPKQFLHPVIAQKVWSAFIRGEYDTAVFQAFKEVEVAVRLAGQFQPTDIGVSLMRKAFDPNRGPLTDPRLPEAEREALAHLFSGAIGSYKNPQSHRSVIITDPVEAAEMIILASHLLKIVNSRKPDVPTVRGAPVS